jgi:hypothetical protein
MLMPLLLQLRNGKAHDEELLALNPTTNPTINPTRHNVTTSANNANLRHPPLFAILGLFLRLAKCFSLS